MRLIDADALLEILEDKTYKLYEFEQGVLKRTGRRSQEHNNAYRELCDWAFFESMVEEQPTVEERPKGKWIECQSGYDQRDHFYKCSECGRFINLICGAKLEDFPYCHCGADMKGEE